MKNRLIIAGALVAIVVVVYFSFIYEAPNGNDISGTVGAVKRYRSEQIADKDVVLSGQNVEASQENKEAAQNQVALFDKAPVEKQAEFFRSNPIAPQKFEELSTPPRKQDSHNSLPTPAC